VVQPTNWHLVQPADWQVVPAAGWRLVWSDRCAAKPLHWHLVTSADCYVVQPADRSDHRAVGAGPDPRTGHGSRSACDSRPEAFREDQQATLKSDAGALGSTLDQPCLLWPPSRFPTRHSGDPNRRCNAGGDCHPRGERDIPIDRRTDRHCVTGRSSGSSRRRVTDATCNFRWSNSDPDGPGGPRRYCFTGRRSGTGDCDTRCESDHTSFKIDGCAFRTTLNRSRFLWPPIGFTTGRRCDTDRRRFTDRRDDTDRLSITDSSNHCEGAHPTLERDAIGLRTAFDQPRLLWTPTRLATRRGHSRGECDACSRIDRHRRDRPAHTCGATHCVGIRAGYAPVSACRVPFASRRIHVGNGSRLRRYESVPERSGVGDVEPIQLVGDRDQIAS